MARCASAAGSRGGGRSPDRRHDRGRRPKLNEPTLLRHDREMENFSPRPLAIIKAVDTLDALRDRHGDFEHWIAAGLGDTSLPVMVLDPRRGDTLPSPAAISGAIVTGSHAMVSHREPW